MQLVEEAVDGCWVGYRARTQIMRDSAIGSVYSPPEKDAGNGQSSKRNLVETVVDIGHREGVRRYSLSLIISLLILFGFVSFRVGS